jgi:N-acetylglucosaminyldiphosphoundecaprenol N-acetyl-beta-D-mannosaminyltransferase
MRDALARGEGGRIVTLDADQHRSVATQPDLREWIAAASLVLTTSTAVVLASRLNPTADRLPARVNPLALTDAVCAACNADARRVFLIGGAPGRAGVPGGAVRASAILNLRHRGLRIAGSASPPDGLDQQAHALDDLIEEVRPAKPDVVLIALPFRAGARLAEAMRAELPGSWFVESPRLVAAVLGDAQPAPQSTALQSARLIVGALTARLVRPRTA